MMLRMSCRSLLLLAALFPCVSASAQDVDFASVLGLGGAAEENASGIALDPMGNSYVAGYFQGTMDADPGPGATNLVSAGNYDGFVAKYDKTGALVWAHRFGSTDFDYLFGVQVDSGGNAYLTGTFLGTVDFDPGAGTTNVTASGFFSESFVWKLDTDGNLDWVRVISGPGSEIGFAIALDPSGNIYSMGQFTGTPDFDPGAGTFNLTALTGNDLYVQKLDSAGSFLWAATVDGAVRDFGRFISLDNSGNLYLTASFQGTVDFDPGAGVTTLVSAGGNDAFVWKLDPGGDLVWAHRFGNAGEDDGLSVAVDTAGNVILAGSFQGTVDFDPGAGTLDLASTSARSLYVVKLTSAGIVDWAGAFTGMDDGYTYGLMTDSAGDVFVVGSFEGTADFDPAAGTVAAATSAGDEDMYTTKLDNTGAWEWTEQRGTAGRELGATIVTDGAGTLYTTGIFSNTLDFDTGVGTTNLTAVGSFDSFILKQIPKVGDIITSNPTPGSIFENDPLTLIAPAGFSNYVWKRDGMIMSDDAPRVTGTRNQMLQYNPVLIADEATFTVTYDDGSKSILESQPYVLGVSPNTGLPAASWIGLAGLGVLLSATGARRTRRNS